MRMTPAIRTMWALLGVMLAVVLIIATGVDVLIFILAYGSHAGSYAGQSGDRQMAWRLLALLAVLWALVSAGMLVPALRWRRRGMYASEDAPGK